MRFVIFFSFFFFLLAFKFAGCQNVTCYDSTKIIIGAVCPPDYDPVCACNAKTFKNYCHAQNDGYQYFISGICDPIDLNVNRNPVYDNLIMELRLKIPNDVLLYIFDIYGNTYFSQQFYYTEKETIFLNTFGFPRGLYLALAIDSAGNKVVKKILKIGI
jgi:hypothetical protein